MKEIHTEIEIESSAEHVWQLLTDFPSFPQWNPSIRRASGEIKVGERLEVESGFSGAKGRILRLRVLKAEPDRELRWLGHLWIPGLFDGEHLFIIEPLGPSRVRFIQLKIFIGLLISLFARRLDTDVPRGFKEMNHALKKWPKPLGCC